MKVKRNWIQIWLLVALMLQAVIIEAQSVTKIAAGGIHSLFLKSDGNMWAMGDRANDKLCDGYIFSGSTNLPELTVSNNVTAIAAGWEHTLFLKSDGSLWSAGYNANGQLGTGDNNTHNNPVKIVPSGVKAIAAGQQHSLFIKNDGSLWGMGVNMYGALGGGTTSPRAFSPVQMVASNVTAIAAGENNSFFIKGDGSLWGVGEYINGNNSTYTNLPMIIVSNNVTAVSAGWLGLLLFLKSDGSLWGMGYNLNGALGNGTYNNANTPIQILSSNVTAIAAGSDFSLFLKSDGSLWGMGGDDYGALGDGKNGLQINTNRPEQIVASGVTAISAGEYHTLFLKSDGSLWGMGYNGDGELGDGTYSITNRPELIVVPMAYNQISAQILGTSGVQLSFVGIARANYALDRSFTLSPPNWIPQATNPAGAAGVLLFTNAPNTATNNFWRIRSVP